MGFRFIAVYAYLFAAYSASGAKITNNKTVVPAKAGRDTVVFDQQYIGHDAKTNEAIKKLDKKLDEIIKLLRDKNCSKPGNNNNIISDGLVY